MSKRKFDDFDNFAGNYRKEHSKNIEKISGTDSDYFSEYKIREIALRENTGHGKVVLDFGCGDGNSAAYFLKHLSPEAYFGIDISAKSIELASQRHLEHCRFLVYDGEHIPFADETIDIVFIACVLHHIDSTIHSSILSECHRVLKENGRLYIFEHNPINPVTRRLVDTCAFDADATLIYSHELKKSIKKLPFADAKRRYTIFFPRKYFFKRMLFLEKILTWCPLGGQYYFRCEK